MSFFITKIKTTLMKTLFFVKVLLIAGTIGFTTTFASAKSTGDMILKNSEITLRDLQILMGDTGKTTAKFNPCTNQHEWLVDAAKAAQKQLDAAGYGDFFEKKLSAENMKAIILNSPHYLTTIGYGTWKGFRECVHVKVKRNPYVFSSGELEQGHSFDLKDFGATTSFRVVYCSNMCGNTPDDLVVEQADKPPLEVTPGDTVEQRSVGNTYVTNNFIQQQNCCPQPISYPYFQASLGFGAGVSYQQPYQPSQPWYPPMTPPPVVINNYYAVDNSIVNIDNSTTTTTTTTPPVVPPLPEIGFPANGQLHPATLAVADSSGDSGAGGQHGEGGYADGGGLGGKKANPNANSASAATRKPLFSQEEINSLPPTNTHPTPVGSVNNGIASNSSLPTPSLFNGNEIKNLTPANTNGHGMENVSANTDLPIRNPSASSQLSTGVRPNQNLLADNNLSANSNGMGPHTQDQGDVPIRNINEVKNLHLNNINSQNPPASSTTGLSGRPKPGDLSNTANDHNLGSGLQTYTGALSLQNRPVATSQSSGLGIASAGNYSNGSSNRPFSSQQFENRPTITQGPGMSNLSTNTRPNASNMNAQGGGRQKAATVSSRPGTNGRAAKR